MAAYAALASLLNNLHDIQNHSRLADSLDRSQIACLGEKLDFLLDFVENHHSHGVNEETQVLERQITTVVHAAEDAIESHIVDRIEQLMGGSSSSDIKDESNRLLLVFLLNMLQIIENSPSLLASPEAKRIESLGQKLDFLLDFIENRDSHEAEVSENQIASEALAVKDQIRDRFESGEAEFDFDDEEISFSFLIDFLDFYMEQILNHPTLWISLDSRETEFFHEVVGFLSYFLDTISEKEVEDLEGQIAEYGIGSQEVESTFNHGETSSTALIDLQREVTAMKKKVIVVSKKIFRKKAVFVGSENNFLSYLQIILEAMDSVMEKVMKVKEEKGFKDLSSTCSMPAASSKLLTTGKANVVGFRSQSVQLLAWLTAEQSHLQIISITGMGGIGKTTLARNVYEDLLFTQHFDVCAWLTLSQEYNVRELLFQTLSSMVKSPEELANKTEDELGVILHKILYGRRYLIILDDVWSVEAWNEISLYFPKGETRSRVVVTTRQSDVANHFGTLRLALNFLDDHDSWDLFCEKAFELGCCPSELENIGRKIVKKCKGLPLSIVVIGGLLLKSSRTEEYWEIVEKDLSSILNTTQDNQCFNILSLSYSHLPAHLKPCFLYLGIFPEDHEIHVTRLIQLWVAEGFLNPNKNPCLEEVGRGYISDLINRNLLLVRGLSTIGKVKTCSIHDLLREFCVKFGEKDKFFCLSSKHDSPRDIAGERRVISVESIEEENHSQLVCTLQSSKFVRSVISESPCQMSPKSRLLRVFSNAYAGSIDIALQVNLRFLECRPNINSSMYSYDLPSSISLLWNLQTLIIEGSCCEVAAPSEIWEMQQLRHLQFHQVFLPRPPQCEEQNRIVLRNLQTLRVAYLYKWSSEVCKRICNIKKLRVTFVDHLEGQGDTVENSCFFNIGCLDNLESFHFDCRDGQGPRGFSQNLKLPVSLKKLSLSSSELNWDDLSMIGSLPHLEVLKLFWNSVRGPEWNSVEGEFPRLRYLQICQCSELIQWNADSSHFPVLENLVLEHLWNLDEIPSGIGDIPTLRDIYLVECSDSAVISAVNLLKEQESLGNEDLQVRVKFWSVAHREEVRAKVELEGFANHKFQLS